MCRVEYTCTPTLSNTRSALRQTYSSRDCRGGRESATVVLVVSTHTLAFSPMCAYFTASPRCRNLYNDNSNSNICVRLTRALNVDRVLVRLFNRIALALQPFYANNNNINNNTCIRSSAKRRHTMITICASYVHNP